MRNRSFRGKILLFLVYAVFAIYFINFQITFLEVPEFIFKFNNLIVFVGGLLLFFSAFRQLMKKSNKFI